MPATKDSSNSVCEPGSEKNRTAYSSMKLELLAVKWAVTEKFRDYLLGVPFVIYPDNNPLSYIQTSAKLTAAEHHWQAELSRQHSLQPRATQCFCGRSESETSAEPNGFSFIDEDEIADILHVTVLPPDLRQKLLKGAAGAVTASVYDIHEDVEPTVLPSLSIVEIQQAQRNDPVLGRIWYYIDRGHEPARRENRRNHQQ